MRPVKTSAGYYEFLPKPSKKELEDFYKNVPLGSGTGYTHEIDDEEYYHRTIGCHESDFLLPKNINNMLDIGCGEGFFLNHFDKKGLEVHGIDFNNKLVEGFFPHLAKHVSQGDLIEHIENFAKLGKKWDFINLTNVIEHVTDPVQTLASVKKILSADGFLRISAPNDFSFVQLDAVSRGYSEDEFWVSFPAHLNYFNTSNFSKFLVSSGLQVNHLLAEFPIEIFLYHKGSNYLKNRVAGSQAHRARIEIENMLAKRSIQELISFRKGCYRAGLGRTIVAYCSFDKADGN